MSIVVITPLIDTNIIVGFMLCFTIKVVKLDLYVNVIVYYGYVDNMVDIRVNMQV